MWQPLNNDPMKGKCYSSDNKLVSGGFRKVASFSFLTLTKTAPLQKKYLNSKSLKEIGNC